MKLELELLQLQIARIVDRIVVLEEVLAALYEKRARLETPPFIPPNLTSAKIAAIFENSAGQLDELACVQATILGLERKLRQLHAQLHLYQQEELVRPQEPLRHYELSCCFPYAVGRREKSVD